MSQTKTTNRMSEMVARMGADEDGLASVMFNLAQVGRTVQRFELTEAIQERLGVAAATRVNEKFWALREAFEG